MCTVIEVKPQHGFPNKRLVTLCFQPLEIICKVFFFLLLQVGEIIIESYASLPEVLALSQHVEVVTLTSRLKAK